MCSYNYLPDIFCSTFWKIRNKFFCKQKNDIYKTKQMEKKLLRKESIIFTHSIFEANDFHNSLLLRIITKYWCSMSHPIVLQLHILTVGVHRGSHIWQLTGNVYHLTWGLVYRVHWAGFAPITYICRFKWNYIARSLLSVLSG